MVSRGQRIGARLVRPFRSAAAGSVSVPAVSRSREPHPAGRRARSYIPSSDRGRAARQAVHATLPATRRRGQGRISRAPSPISARRPRPLLALVGQGLKGNHRRAPRSPMARAARTPCRAGADQRAPRPTRRGTQPSPDQGEGRYNRRRTARARPPAARATRTHRRAATDTKGA
jgi:hypothetical protein